MDYMGVVTIIGAVEIVVFPAVFGWGFFHAFGRRLGTRY